MGRHGQPKEIRDKIFEMAAAGGKMKPIARELGLTHPQVERVLFPERVKLRDRRHRKPCARILRLDREELPEGNFDLYENGRQDWLTG